MHLEAKVKEYQLPGKDGYKQEQIWLREREAFSDVSKVKKPAWQPSIAATKPYKMQPYGHIQSYCGRPIYQMIPAHPKTFFVWQNKWPIDELWL